MKEPRKIRKIHLQTCKQLKALKSRMNDAEEQMSDLKDRIMEIIHSGQQPENQMKTHGSNVRDLGDNIKQVDLHIRVIPERGGKETGIGNIYEGVPVTAQWLTNPTSIHENMGSIPALPQWVTDLALL